MCGRYAMGIRASFVRHQLQEQGLPVEDAPDDDDVRETYNFAPGHWGLVYRADIPDHGLRDDDTEPRNDAIEGQEQDDADEAEQQPPDTRSQSTPNKSSTRSKTSPTTLSSGIASDEPIHYHLKAMKWGLIPFWTKRSPDYGSMMRTINCRDDSLIENRGMWNTMKQRKRCIVLCQGFYEWLKKGPGGKEKIPHFVKRKDGYLMAFAGLWDCVKYEDTEDKLYTYTIITTDSNQQLKFLHDRMPVILGAGSKAMETWLDPRRNTWSKELQSLLKPFDGDLECYPVKQDVGKVGNNSPEFIIPLDSKENKANIANFFCNAAAKGAAKKAAKEGTVRDETNTAPEVKSTVEQKVEYEDDPRQTEDQNGSENNAPIPFPAVDKPKTGNKRSRSPEDADEESRKALKATSSPTKPPQPQSPPASKKKSHSATSNNTKAKTPLKKANDGTQRITNFFVK